MWSKISHRIKPATKQGHEDPEPSGSQADTMSGVSQQHPDFSVFHRGTESPGPLSSLSKHQDTFKRITKGHRNDPEPRPATKLPIGFLKKVKSALSIPGNSESFFLSLFAVGMHLSYLSILQVLTSPLLTHLLMQHMTQLT